jgi:hypothetical protein
MAKKKAKRESKKQKLERAMEAFYNAGAPAEGVVVDGTRYMFMDFGEDWKKEMEARPVPTKTKAPRKTARAEAAVYCLKCGGKMRKMKKKELALWDLTRGNVCKNQHVQWKFGDEISVPGFVNEDCIECGEIMRRLTRQEARTLPKQEAEEYEKKIAAGQVAAICSNKHIQWRHRPLGAEVPTIIR